VILVILVILGLGAMPVGLAQAPTPPPAPTQLFSGTVNVRGARPGPVNVAAYYWVFHEQQRVAVLDVPLKGTVVLQVRTGSVTTVIGGRRQLRREGEFWTLAAGVSMGIESGNDTAVVEAVVVAE